MTTPFGQRVVVEPTHPLDEIVLDVEVPEARMIDALVDSARSKVPLRFIVADVTLLPGANGGIKAHCRLVRIAE